MPSRFVSKSRRFLGLRHPQWIKGFFGGSAVVSSVIIFLISIFLILEAVRFFPSHRAELKLARRSGQEYADFLIRETGWSQQVLGLFRQVYFRERDHRFANETDLIEGFAFYQDFIEDEAEEQIEALDAALAKGNEGEINQAREALRIKGSELIGATPTRDVDFILRLRKNAEQWTQLVEAVSVYDPLAGKVPASIEAAGRAVERGLADFSKAKSRAEAAVKPLEDLRDRLVAYTAESRKDAEKGGESDLEGRIQFVVDAHFKHVRHVRELEVGIMEAVGFLPDTGSTPEIGELLERIGEKAVHLTRRLGGSIEDAGEWDWREEVSWLDSASAFFFGTEWRAGSSWRQVFGLLPLITGTLLVSMIAMLVAVPLALAAAVYVNQLATRREQTLIKPSIEMIQAIPSVVLGFFGVVVLGDLLMELSASSWLSWLPGFPVTERLNLLNAGLLLSLMAVPTVFTLCEDALHQVPRSLSEASLALGASRISTVGKVVIPAAFSGIVAGVLLGFGRVIGETMVVLLVAGNRISMPDWGSGLALFTHPGHTLTGVIADEMGHVTTGTLHYRALFLLGLILFVISLAVHLVAQRFVKRYFRYG
jgi:phosphate transport system permease protein